MRSGHIFHKHSPGSLSLSLSLSLSTAHLFCIFLLLLLQPQLPESCEALDKTKRHVLYCLGGFRSSIAVSLLRSKGVDATDFVDGYDRGILQHACHATTAQEDVCKDMAARGAKGAVPSPKRTAAAAVTATKKKNDRTRSISCVIS